MKTYGYFRRPLIWYVHVSKDGAAELISRFVGIDGGVIGVAQSSVRVDVRNELLHVAFEVVNDDWIGVKLLNSRIAEVKLVVFLLLHATTWRSSYTLPYPSAPVTLMPRNRQKSNLPPW